MIQSHRNVKSKSLLREAESAILLIKDKKLREYFLKKIKEVVEKRKNKIYLTGETAVKRELLAYFKQNGETKTANIWARDLIIDQKKINELLLIIQKELVKNNIEGIVEIHLQDREINSPHIQYVGNNAEKAEHIISKILVDLKYELNMESAMSKKEKPYYEINNKARTAKLDDYLEYEKTYKEKREINKINQMFEFLNEQLSSFKKYIDTFKKRRIEKTSIVDKVTKTKENIENSNDRFFKLKMRIKRRRR